jgi:hypothetical protein
VKVKQQKRKERKLRAKAKKRAGQVTQDGQKLIQTFASKVRSISAPELIVFNDPRKRKRPESASSSSSLQPKKAKLSADAEEVQVNAIL